MSTHPLCRADPVLGAPSSEQEGVLLVPGGKVLLSGAVQWGPPQSPLRANQPLWTRHDVRHAQATNLWNLFSAKQNVGEGL